MLVDTDTGEIVRVTPAEMDAASDPVGFVLACCEQANTALHQAQTATEGLNILGVLSTLEHAVKVRNLNAEAAIAASAMRVRAERRVGELIAAERESGTLESRGGDRRSHLRPINLDEPEVDRPPETATLADIGISYDQAAEFSKLAAVPDADFEEAVEAQTERARKQGGTNVTRAGVLRLVNPEAEKSPNERWLDADKFVTACQRLASLRDDALSAIRFGRFPGDLPLVADDVERHLRDAVAALTSVLRAWEGRNR